MRLNLHIIKEELNGYEFQDNIYEPASTMNISEVFYCTGPIKKFEKDVLYITRSEYLQPRNKVYTSPALICIGEPSLEWLSSHTNILYTKANVHITELYRQIIEIFAKYRRLENEFNRMLEESESLDDLTSILSAYLNNPLSVENASYDVIYQYFPHNTIISEEKETLYNFLYRDGKRTISNAEILMLNTDRRYKALTKASTPSTIRLATLNQNILMQNIRNKDALIGCVEIIEMFQPFTSKDYIIITLVSSFIKRWFRSNFKSEIVDDDLGTIINSLVNKTDYPTNKLNLALVKRKWEINDNYVCIIASQKHPGQSSIPNPREYLRPLALYVSDFCQTTTEDFLVLVCNLTRSNLTRDKIIKYYSRFYTKMEVSSCISVEYNDITQSAYAFSQNGVLIKIGSYLYPKEKIYLPENLYVEYFIHKAKKNQIPSFLTPRPLATLIAYDDSHNTEYVNVLKVYLQNERNIADTARALFVHRNTLLYQLSKIEEIMDTKLDNPDERLITMLALKVRENNFPDFSGIHISDVINEPR